VDYALCGGVALAIHGVPRATQDIDLLVRPEDLSRLREVARMCGFVFESFPMDFASGITAGLGGRATAAGGAPWLT